MDKEYIDALNWLMMPVEWLYGLDDQVNDEHVYETDDEWLILLNEWFNEQQNAPDQ
jgi:hypothetical protein